MDADNLLKEVLLEIVNSSSKEEVQQIIYDFELKIVNSNLSFAEKNRITKQIMEVKRAYGLFDISPLLVKRLGSLKGILRELKEKVEFTAEYSSSEFYPDWNLNKKYGVFGVDNTFNIAHQNSLIKPFLFSNTYANIYEYLVDDFSDKKITAVYNIHKVDSPWQSGAKFKCNGIYSYAVPLDKLIDYKSTSSRYMQDVKETVNFFLAENPDFVEEVFIRERTLK